MVDARGDGDGCDPKRRNDRLRHVRVWLEDQKSVRRGIGREEHQIPDELTGCVQEDQQELQQQGVRRAIVRPRSRGSEAESPRGEPSAMSTRNQELIDMLIF